MQIWLKCKYDWNVNMIKIQIWLKCKYDMTEMQKYDLNVNMI
jgi:hypothetical protein